MRVFYNKPFKVFMQVFEIEKWEIEKVEIIFMSNIIDFELHSESRTSKHC